MQGASQSVSLIGRQVEVRSVQGTIVRAHYYEQREFQSLAEELRVSKGRISRLHAQALARLRALLEERPALDRRL